MNKHKKRIKELIKELPERNLDEDEELEIKKELENDLLRLEFKMPYTKYKCLVCEKPLLYYQTEDYEIGMDHCCSIKHFKSCL